MAGDNRMKFEAEFDFDTKSAAQKAQSLLQTLNKFKDVEAQGNAEIKKMQRGLQGVANEANKAWGDRGLGKVTTNLVNIDRWNKKLEQTRTAIKVAKAELDSARATRAEHLKNGDSNILDVANIKAASDELDKQRAKEKDLLSKIKAAEQENVGLNKAAANFVKEFDNAFNKAIDIRALFNEMTQEQARLAEEEKKGVVEQEKAANAAKKTADATEDIINAQRTLNDEKSKVTSAPKDTTGKSTDDSEKIVQNSKKEENAIKDIVQQIYAARVAGKETTDEFNNLINKLNEINGTTDIGAISKYVTDIGKSIQYIKKDLEGDQRMNDVFTSLKQAIAPANKALREFDSTAAKGSLKTGTATKPLYVLTEAYRQVRQAQQQALDEKLSQQQAAQEAQATRDRMNLIYSLVAAYQQEKQAQHQALDEQLAAQKEKQARDSVNSVYAMAAAAQQLEREYQEALQYIRDVANQIDTMSFEGAKENIATLDRNLGELQSAQSVAKALDIPPEVEKEYNKITEAIDRVKQAKKEANEEPFDATKIKEAAASVSTMKFSVDKDTGIDELLRNLAKLEQAKSTLKSMGFPPQFKSEITAIDNGIIKLKQGITDYHKRMDGARNSGTSFGDTVRRGVNIAKRAFAEMRGTVQGVSKALETLIKIVSKFASAFSKIGKSTTKAKSSFESMAHSMRSNFKHMITNITKYVFGFRSLFFLIRRLRKYLGEGIQNLVRFEDGANPVNYAISNMLSSLLYLKNAWAAAFSPIIMYVEPILVRLIDALAAAGNALARFLSALLGCEVTFNAVRVSAGDYADKLGGVGDSAGGAADKVKKLNDRLADFDDLNVLGKDNDDEDTGSGGGGGGGASDLENYNDMFEIVANGNKWADMIKEAWANADFTEIGIMVRNKLVDALEKMAADLEAFRPTAYKIGKCIITFLNGVFKDEKLWVSAGKAVGSTINVISSFFRGILENNEVNFGKGIADFINSLIDRIDWNMINQNIVDFANQLKENIKNFLGELRWEDEGVQWDWSTMESYYVEGIYTVFENIGTTIGQVVADVFGDVDLMSSIGTFFANLTNAFTKGFAKFLDEIKNAHIGEALAEGINSFFRDTNWDEIVNNISTFVTTLKTNIIAYIDGIQWEGEGGIYEAMTKLGTAIGDALSDTLGDEEFMGKLGEGIGKFINAFVLALDAALGDDAGESGNQLGNALYSFVSNILANIDTDTLANDFADIIILILNSISQFSEKITAALNEDETVQEALENFFLNLKLDSVFEALGRNISSSTTAATTIATALETIITSDAVNEMMGRAIAKLLLSIDVGSISMALAELVGKILGDTIVHLPEHIDAFAKGLAEVVSEEVGKAFSDIEFKEDFALGFWRNIVTVLATVIGGVPGGVLAYIFTNVTEGNFTWDDVMGAIIPDDFNTWANGVWEDFKEFGTQLKEGLCNGLGFDNSEAANWIREHVFNPVMTALGLEWLCHSPSKVMEEFGENLILGLKQGIENLIDTVLEPFNDLKTKITEIWDKFKQDAEEKWTAITAPIKDKMGEAKDWVEEKAGVIQEGLTTAWDTISTSTTAAWNWIAGEVTGSLTEIGDAGVNAGIVIEESANNTVDSMSTVRDAFDETSTTVTTYSTTAEMYIKQHDQTLNNSANTADSWSSTLGHSTDNVSSSWSALGDTVRNNGDLYVSTVDRLETETGDVNLSVTTDFDEMATGVDESTTSMSETIDTTWQDLGITVPENVTLMTETVYTLFYELSENIKPIWESLRLTVYTAMVNTRLQAIAEATNINTTLYGLFLKTQQETTMQFNTLASNVVSAFNNLASNVKSPMNSFLSSVESMVNHATDALNRLIDNVNQCLSMGSEWLNYMGLPDIGTQSHVPHVSIPRLAQGAVIPPNKEFLAILGDQSHGTNIEAPLDTIKQAVAEVLLANNSNQEVVELLQQLIQVVDSKELTIGDKEIGKANARYVNNQRLIRGTSF